MTDKRSKPLQDVVDGALAACLAKHTAQNLRPEEIAVSLIDMRDPASMDWAGYREDELIYPASVVKLFYAVAAYHWLKQGKIQRTAEFDRAMKDMIVDSSNDATGYIVDLLTQTTSGPELPEADMPEWLRKRNVVNEFFAGLGYDRINVNQKTWGDGPYGRERVSVGQMREKRNKLTVRLTARLLADIVQRKAAAPELCDELLAYMHRDRATKSEELDDFQHGFLGDALPQNAQYWAKAGWTSIDRHDALYVHLTDSASDVNICLVVFTVNHSNDQEILATVGSEIISRMRGLKNV